jgi:hypothetical protein
VAACAGTIPPMITAVAAAAHTAPARRKVIFTVEA